MTAGRGGGFSRGAIAGQSSARQRRRPKAARRYPSSRGYVECSIFSTWARSFRAPVRKHITVALPSCARCRVVCPPQFSPALAFDVTEKCGMRWFLVITSVTAAAGFAGCSCDPSATWRRRSADRLAPRRLVVRRWSLRAGGTIVTTLPTLAVPQNAPGASHARPGHVHARPVSGQHGTRSTSIASAAAPSGPPARGGHSGIHGDDWPATVPIDPDRIACSRRPPFPCPFAAWRHSENDFPLSKAGEPLPISSRRALN